MLKVVNNTPQAMPFSEVSVGTIFAMYNHCFIKTESLYTHDDFCARQGTSSI